MNNKKIILSILISIPVLLLMISAVSAADFEDDLKGYELSTTNVVEIEDHGKVNIPLDKDDFLNGKDYYASDFDKVVKTNKNYKLQKKPTKKVKTVTYKTSHTKKQVIKQLKKIKQGKAGKWGLACQHYSNGKACKILKNNKIKSYKLTKSYKWYDSPGGKYKSPVYTVKVKYYVCKNKKVVKPLKVRVHVNWQRYSNDEYSIGYIKYKDAQGFTYKYYFDFLSDKLVSKLGV